MFLVIQLAQVQQGLGDQDELFWGAYSHFKVTEGIIAEPYLIIRNRSRDADNSTRKDAAYVQPGEAALYSLGARIAW